jgi:exosortase/archaeosortase family protein
MGAHFYRIPCRELVRLATTRSNPGAGVMHPLLVTALVVAATWDAWRWYFIRVWPTPEEAATLALTILFLGLVGAMRAGKPGQSKHIPILRIACGLALYATGHAFLPSIASTAVAVALGLFCLHVAMLGERPPVAFWGLVALSLPVLPSLQYVLGYPMRVVSAAITVSLLQAYGLTIARQGTLIVWREELIQFDAPCSGVNMLWAGLLLTLMACVLLRLSIGQVVVAVGLTVILTVGSNVLRAVSLFYVETGLLPEAPGWWHDGIGIAAFVLSGGATLWAVSYLRRGGFAR